MEAEINDNTQTQTQTQNSQVEWTQSNTPTPIPNIWGRLYLLNSWKKECIVNLDPYYDLTEPEFSVGRALDSTFPIKKDTARIGIIKNVSKRHFIIMRDRLETSSPAVITDTSYNGTYINGVLIGKGKSRVLDDNDVIAITHPTISMFTFKDLLKNEQDKVPKEIAQKYYISRVLGQGACGVVKLVYNKPCVTSVEEIFDSRDAVYIVLELMQGGELFDRITRYGRLSERLTKFYFKQMVLAVQYLHSQGITHRDLKPENVLLESKEDESLVKITDFGLSKYVGEDSFMKTMCGTPIYLAPEVLRANGVGCYGPEVDVWCLGVIFFICLVGYLPFSPEYKELPLSEQILSGRYRYSSSCWRDVSLQAKLLMKRMLTVNVRRRISLEQILKHPWMQDDDINLKINVLLSQHQLKNGNKENDEEKSDVVVVRLVAANKRPLSDSSNTAEPIAKKVRVGRKDENDDTSSATSCYSDE